MAEKSKTVKMKSSERVKVSAQEAIKYMRDFAKRKERFVAAVRKGKGAC